MNHRLPLIAAFALALLGSASASASVVARFDCRSFGQTASSGGSLNLKYATPLMCWASATTVSGVAVNEKGWVPEVFFDWTWDDNSLGNVTRGGLSMDLGKSVGVVAAHAFKPTAFSESCGGAANNSSHAVKLTVTALENGQRTSSTATLNVCVENPRTTWPTPIAFCNDSNCADDPGVPPGTIHGGTNTDLGTILSYCQANGSERVLVKGGVTFSTGSTNIKVGRVPCLVESYGTGRAKLHFTSDVGSAISASDAACAGFRLNNVTLAGAGGGPRVISGGADTGCFLLVDSAVSTIPGEEFSSLNTSGGANSTTLENYYFKFDYTRHSTANNGIFTFVDYFAFVGGEISGINADPIGAHNIRLPQWNYAIVDASRFADQSSSKHVLTFRQDCGGSSSCPNHAQASVLAISRNEIRANVGGAVPVQICAPGSGSPEPTKCYDIEIIRNLGSWDIAGTQREFFDFPSSAAGSERARVRILQNAFEFGAQASTSYERPISGSISDAAIIGNVVSATGGTQTYSVAALGASAGVVAKNNLCFENGPGDCDPFPNLSEGTDNKVLSVDPFDGSAGVPKTGVPFQFSQLQITASSPLANSGALDAIPTDIAGNARGQSVGIFGTGSVTAPPPPSPSPPPPATNPPAAPVLL